MRSASEHSEPIDPYVGNELSGSRLSRVSISRFRVIPKPHQPGKYRLKTDLSSPKGGSVNNGVDPVLCSVSYAFVDDAIQCIRRLGRSKACEV